MENPGPRVRDNRVLVPLKVTPKSRTNALEGWDNGRLKVKVTAPPDKGKANQAVVELLAKEWRLPKSAIEIISGQASREKIVSVAAPGDPEKWLRDLQLK